MAAARGLCRRHYQRLKRGTTKDRPGPPPKYELRAKGGGAPQINIRLEPEVYAWVKDNGGARWLRRMLRELRVLSGSPNFSWAWKRLKTPPHEEASS